MDIPATWSGRTRTPTAPTCHGRPISRTCGTTRSPAWSTPAPRNRHPSYDGPFGDIKDTLACEDQFRNVFLLGCVGAWSLHPVQIDIARRVFSPDPAYVADAEEVIEAMGDGTGALMLNGKMEDDASVKQCHVMVGLAHALAERDPELAGTLWLREGRLTCRAARSDAQASPLGAVHARCQRARAREGQGTTRRRPHPRPRGCGRT